MKLLSTFAFAGLLQLSAAAISQWGFSEAIVSVGPKGAGDSSLFRDKLSDHVPLSKNVVLKDTDTLKIVLSAVNGKRKAVRPHQALFLLRDQDSGLEVFFPFALRENGKGKVELTRKDIPAQLGAKSALRATILLGAFGTDSEAFSNHVFNLEVEASPKPVPTPLRYGKLDEIHHIFRADPTSPPKVVSLVFTAAVLVTLPILLGSWLSLGANLNHLSAALSSSPLSHITFLGSIVGLEFIFFLYYKSWTLFQVLPAIGAVGLVAFVSGSRALGEVQARRLAGKR